MFRTRRRKRVNWRVIANRCILSVLLGCANLFREFDCERTRKKHVFLLRVNLREFSILSRVYRCWKAVESSFLAHFPISFKRKRNSEFVAPISGRMSGDSLEIRGWTAGLFMRARQPDEIVVPWKRYSREPSNDPTASVARCVDRIDFGWALGYVRLAFTPANRNSHFLEDSFHLYLFFF